MSWARYDKHHDEICSLDHSRRKELTDAALDFKGDIKQHHTTVYKTQNSASVEITQYWRTNFGVSVLLGAELYFGD
jgi:hypothetical protein